MTLILTGINRIRDLVSSDIDKGQLGTGTSASSESDTALQTPDATTLLTITKSTSDKQLNFTFTLPSSGGTTTTYSEFELQKSSTPVHFDRIVFTGISFTTGGTEELSIVKRYFFKRV